MKADLILSNVKKHIVLAPGEAEYFISTLKEKQLEKHELLLKVDAPCDRFNFVCEGALRAYFRDENDKEATIMFATKDWWITDMPAFVAEKPAMISIEAISKSTVLQLDKRDMDKLLLAIPKFERYFRILMQNAYVREQLRILQTLSLPAETRYKNFIKKYPELVQQVPQKNVASYLGITPEFLSALRAKAKKNQIS